MHRPSILLFLAALIVSAVMSCTSGATTPAAPTNASSLATSLLAAPYNSQVRPDLDKRVPVTVNISIYVIEVTATNEVNMDFSTSMYFRRIWKDDRLTYNSSLTDMLSIGFMVDRIWQPDIYFLNEKAGTFHTVTVPNILLQVFPDGRVILSTKYTLLLSCQFQLALYPMDSQVCNIEFGSYGYRTDDILLRWNADSAVVLSEMASSLPEYDIVNSSQQDCTTGYAVTGRYACLRVSLLMRRKFNYYLIQVYIPSTLVVVLSWVSFWIDHHATPARITLSLLTVLTVTTQSSSVTSGMPRVSYIKSIDVWLTGCLTFVFMALIEFAIVNVVQRQSGMLRTAEKWRRPRKMLGVANAMRKQQNASAAQKAAAAQAKDAEQQSATAPTTTTALPDGCHGNSNGGPPVLGGSQMAPQKKPDTQQESPAGPSEAAQTERAGHRRQGWLFRHKPAIVHYLKLRCFCQQTPTTSDMTDAEFVDFLAQRIFPTAFMLFNAVYWIYYKTMQHLGV